MSIVYTWSVTGMKVTRAGDLVNYVMQTYWKKIGTDESGVTGEFCGATPFAPNPSQQDFTPFDQLTEEIVLSWIEPLVVGHYEEHVNSVIAKQIEGKLDPVIDEPLPWVSPAPTPEPTPAL
jgi:hypothetical protein